MASRIASPDSWISCIVRAQSSNCPSSSLPFMVDATMSSIRLWGRFADRFDGSFDGVGEHDYAGLFAPRAAAGVAEIGLTDGFTFEGVPQRCSVEVFDAARAVMLGDDVQDLLRQVPGAPDFPPRLSRDV